MARTNLDGIPDQARVETVLFRLRQFWEEFPDMRLGQIIANATWEHDKDIFFLTDQEFLDCLEKYRESLKNNL
jgi:hypothetical protein